MCADGLAVFDPSTVPTPASAIDESDNELTSSEKVVQTNSIVIGVVIAILAVLIVLVCVALFMWKRHDGKLHFHHDHNPEHHAAKEKKLQEEAEMQDKNSKA